MKWLGAFVICLLTFSGAAQAADRALVELIGYSEDGRYFAFEQYGVHDGSGAPYASITVLDLQSEDPATPIKHFEESGVEDDVLAPMRAKVAAEAAADLKALALSQPAQFVSMVGDGVSGADGFHLRFGTPGSGPIGEVFGDKLLQLEVFDTADTTGCFEPETTHASGLSLMVVTSDDRRQVFTDPADAPPAWRHCPIDYRLYAVVLPVNGDITQAVALISLYTVGWEGADRSFMAIPVGK